MHRFLAAGLTLGLAAFLLVGGPGCNARARQADADRARAALRTALDAWKRGDNLDALQQLDPPIYFNDHDVRAGSRLLDFKINSEDDYFGNSLRCAVELSLKDAAGKTRQKTIKYLIDTGKATVIAREDLGY